MQSPSERLKRLLNDPISANMPASYGMTQLELAELNMKQIEGTEPYVKCNLNPDFEIQECETDHIFLLLVEAVLFDQTTGERLSRPRLLKLRPEIFYDFVEKGHFNGKTVEILHKPKSADKYEENLRKQRENQEKRDENMKAIFDKNRLKGLEAEMKILKKSTTK